MVGSRLAGGDLAGGHAEILLRQRQQAALAQLGMQAVAQLDQVMRIQPGVVDQMLGQRALTPVGALVAFVQRNAQLGLQHRPQPDLVATQDAPGDHRVEQVGDLHAEITAQAQQVVFRGVEHLFDLRIAEQWA